MADAPQTWILTASPENHEATKAHGFEVIGIKERNRPRALQIEPGDRIVLYLTKVMSFAGSIKICGDMYEDRTKLWPGKPGKADAYPWRFPTEPEIVLEQRRVDPRRKAGDQAGAHQEVACRALEARLPRPAAHRLGERREVAGQAHGRGRQDARLNLVTPDSAIRECNRPPRSSRWGAPYNRSMLRKAPNGPSRDRRA